MIRSKTSNTYFRFRQFTVSHDRCAMKVGTDGILLGAWAHVEGCRRILDIGCGCGLLFLMAAQRNAEAQVCGVELNHDAALQAAENALRSPFAGRVSIREADVRDFSDGQFDCVICNPPFFTSGAVPPNGERALARSDISLTFTELWHAVERLTTADAFFNVILPFGRMTAFTSQANMHGFGMTRLCRVHALAGRPALRALITYRKALPAPQLWEESELIVGNANGSRTEEFARLTSDFYL
ncbi:MAG: methyltransferase [Prevotellaceae bacterium]|nr:methyltransferase [Prevotellaceae bacterium]